MKRTRTPQLSRRRVRPQALRARSFFRPLIEQFEDRRLLATVTVNTTSDVNDGTTSSIAALLTAPGADGVISLREAIIAANNTANVDGPDADSTPDPDLIAFNIPGGGVKTITPTTALPAVTQAVVIDGYTQPGASPNTLVVGSDAVLLIELVGGVGPGNGLVISADSSTVRGLVINRFGSAAIHVASGGNTIEGNWLGIEEDGNTRRANEYDVFVGNSPTSARNLIGGTTPSSRNVMAGTAGGNAGIMLFPGGGAATIQGNYIGMNAQGTDGIGASGRIYLGTPGNLVGGTSPGAGNVISGRAIEVYAASNTVQGNTFGLNASGTATLANNLNGIFIASHSSPTDNNLIGGTTPEARNVFATSGTAMDIANSTGANVGNRVQGNYFGMNKAGVAPAGLVNPSVSGTAIRISGGMNNLIGGTVVGAGNVIANYGNGYGMEVLGSNNTIQGNLIGTDPAGTAAILNAGGIYVGNYVSNNLIGGSAPGAANVIAGNKGDGILVGPAGTFNTIQGNLIGLAADGVSPLGNGTAGGNPVLRNGIRVEGSDNVIGGTGAGEGNKIAFNFGSGVLLPFTNVVGGSGLRNSVLGNSIYSNGGLGIDFFGNGVTANDLNDPDSGQPNDLQNFPVITSATTAGGTTIIQGTLNSTPSSTFRVELFASAAADGSGFGEGQTYLGFVTVTTNASGNGSFSFVPTTSVPVGQFITSTATSSNGSTSELSAVRVVVVPPNQPPTITSNGGGDTASVNVLENTTAATTVTATDPDAGTTLQYSIAGGTDAGKFAINTTTGALSFVTAPNFEVPTDADTNNSYVVIVQASDGSLADLQTLTVTVTNVNETPMITSTGGGDTASISVPENTTAVTTVTATDPDAETTLTYSIAGGADAGKFTIDAMSGMLAFIAAPSFEAPTDADLNNSYLVIVRASDGSLADLQTLSVNVQNVPAPDLQIRKTNNVNGESTVGAPWTWTIHVGNGGDGPATFSSGQTIVFDNLPVGDVSYGPVTVTNLSNVSGSGSIVFSIDANSNLVGTAVGGSVTLGGSVVTASSFTRVATGPGTAQLFGLTSDAQGRIYIGNNSNNTTGISVQRFDPALFSGTPVALQNFGPAVGDADGIAFGNGSIYVPDRDEGIRRITVPGGSSNIFVADTGINGTGSPIVVRPSDGHVFVGFGTTVPGAPGDNRIDEYDAAGNFVKTFTTVGETETMTFDPESGLIYYAPFGTAVRAFDPRTEVDTLIGNSSGFVDGGLAFDPISKLLFVGTANGLNSGRVETLDPVTGVNRPFASGFNGCLGILREPVSGDLYFLESNQLFRIRSDQVLSGFDVQFTVTAAAAGTFVNPRSGGSASVDPDNKISESNEGNNTASDAVTVVNRAPTITSNGGGDSASVSVPENTTAVTTVVAADPDVGATLTYSISGGADAARFSINAATGALQFTAAPNFEAPTDADANNTYLVIVQASDGSSSNSQALTVTVTNANEAPVITSNGGGDAASVSVPENTMLRAVQNGGGGRLKMVALGC